MSEVAGERVLLPGDEARLFRFLERHVDTSLFFFSNVERAGLVDRGEALQATYVACFDAGGQITAVAGHAWNGNVMVQGDEGLERAVLLATSCSSRAVRGIVGPWPQVVRARAALGLSQTRAAHDGKELLFVLELAALKIPDLLKQGRVELREPSDAEAEQLLNEWRADYLVECLGAVRSPELAASAREQIARWRERSQLWVLVRDARVVAVTGFNAEARGTVQVGGVFTPPALRGKGYARAAVAASLQLAQQRGTRRSVLFTAEHNQPARRAYGSLGYEVTGDFGLVLF
jgi:RimJ/RimL family protein N-acetyltransferase